MRSLRPALATGLSLLVVSACSSASDTQDQGDTTSPTVAETSTEASTASEPADPTEPTSQSSGDTLSGDGYDVTPPTDWQDVTEVAKQSNPQADVAMAEPQEAADFRTNFNVVAPSPVSADVTEQELAGQAAKELKSVTGTAVTPVDGPDFDGTTALGQTSETSASGFDVTLIQYLVIHDGKVYATTMTFESKRSDEAQNDLDDIVSSWTWQS